MSSQNAFYLSLNIDDNDTGRVWVPGLGNRGFGFYIRCGVLFFHNIL